MNLIFPNYRTKTVQHQDDTFISIESYVRVKAIDGRYFLVKIVVTEKISGQLDVIFFTMKKFITECLKMQQHYKITTEMINRSTNDPFDLSLILDQNQEEESIRILNMPIKYHV